MRPHMMPPPDGVIHYAEVCTWIGALSFAQAGGNKELTARLVEPFEPLYREERNLVPEPKHDDWTVFGSLPLEIYTQTGEMRGLALGEWMAQRQWGKPFGNPIEERAGEFAPMGHSWQTRLWIDDMFMITAIQSQAFRATGDRGYIDRTAMFTFAFIAGVKEGWLDADTYGPVARRAWLALVTYLDADANIREACVGTGARNDRQHYLDRPRVAGDFHGQAPVLWCASALAR